MSSKKYSETSLHGTLYLILEKAKAYRGPKAKPTKPIKRDIPMMMTRFSIKSRSNLMLFHFVFIQVQTFRAMPVRWWSKTVWWWGLWVGERESEGEKEREWGQREKKVHPTTIRKKVLCSVHLYILSNSIKSHDIGSGFNEVWSEHCWRGRCTGRDMDKGRNVIKSLPNSFHSLSDINPLLCLCQGFDPLPLPSPHHEALC